MKKGFTLIELLLGMGVMSILAYIVIVAINPMHQFGIARNAKRRMNVNAIIKATQQYIIDYETFPVFMGGALIDDTVKNICRTNASVIECIFGNNGA